MRSSSGPGIVSAMFAVAMKRTSREVELDVEVVVAERVVLRRVEHLEQRRRRVAAPVGADLVDLVEQDHRVHRPGVAQGADEPARQRADVGAAVAADLGLVADAAERHAHELAPGARGRSTRRSRSCRCREGRSASGSRRSACRPRRRAPCAASRTAMYSMMRSFTSSRPAWSASSTSRVYAGRAAPRSACPTARRAASRGRCGSSIASGDCSPMRSRRASSRSACSRTSSGISASAIFVRYSSTTERLVLAELLADRLHLRRRMYSRCCFSAPDSTSSRIRLRTCSSASRSRWSSSASSSRSRTSTRLEQLDLLLEGEVGRVAGGVGERARLGDRAHEGGDAAVVAAQLEDLLDDRAVLALELARRAVGGLVVGALLDLDAQPALRRRCARRRRRRGGARRARRACPPPGSRMRSVTSATVPTFANSPSCSGTSRTRSSSPTSTVRVTFMFGKTTMSSRGTSSRRVSVLAHDSRFRSNAVGSSRTVATECRAASARCLSPRCAAKARRASSTRTRPARTSDEIPTPLRAARHDAGDEDAAAARRRGRCRAARSRSSRPCAGPRHRGSRRSTRSSFGRSRT